jgi:hypothetical protein
MRSLISLGLAFSLCLSGCGSDDDETSAPPGTSAPPLAPTIACEAMLDSLYQTPSDLPAFDASVRGKVIGCGKLSTIPEAEVKQRLAAVRGRW